MIAAGEGVGLERVTFEYGQCPVLRGVSLSVPVGGFFTILGPSGCGKTTLLKLIGGYQFPDSGRVRICGRDVTSLPPESRNAGMVFQNFALFPHLTARQNVAFGLDVRRVARVERRRRVEAMLDRVGLSEAERDRRPAALSGGQQQRVALARALVIEPDVLLLDEPLANLDRHLRDRLRGEIRLLQRQTRVTAVLVTHDQEEAMAVSDVLGVMSHGRIVHVGPPADVYARPRTSFVARALGTANLFDGKLAGRPGTLLMVRPEQCVLLAEGTTGSWPGRVAGISFLGADLVVDVQCDNGVSLSVRARNSGLAASVGDRIAVLIPDEVIWAIPDAEKDDTAVTNGGGVGPQSPFLPV
jgi:ABC-type Fe3+/spermidine/putrescine transport system ATPase subunit